MHLIDEIHTNTPFYGSRRITETLKRKGYHVNIKRVKGLMRHMGITAIYPKPNTSKGCSAHKVYPYLLKGMTISSSNQVWCSDITYIRLRSGFMYLVAVMDWYSRYVLSWELSNTLDTYFCISALTGALDRKLLPFIFNTDQGSQFTSRDFTCLLIDKGVKVSMDSKGRAYDNIFIERLWRSLKYEDIYIKSYESVSDLRIGLREYFDFYNNKRYHQALGYKTPSEVYFLSRGGD